MIKVCYYYRYPLGYIYYVSTKFEMNNLIIIMILIRLQRWFQAFDTCFWFSVIFSRYHSTTLIHNLKSFSTKPSTWRSSMSITNFLFIILYIYLFQNHCTYYSILSIPKECQDTFSWLFKGQRDVHGQICVIQNVSGQLQHYLFVWAD